MISLWFYYSKVLRCVPVWTKDHRFILGNLRLPSKILGSLRPFSENFGESSEIFESVRKYSENRQNKQSLVCLCNKLKNLGCLQKRNVFSHQSLNAPPAGLTREISSWTLEEKFHIYAHPCVILYISMHSSNFKLITWVFMHL